MYLYITTRKKIPSEVDFIFTEISKISKVSNVVFNVLQKTKKA